MAMQRIHETLVLIADKLKTVPGITDAGLDIKTQQPGNGVDALVAVARIVYNPQRTVDRFECSITLRAAANFPISDFFPYFDATTEEPRSIYRAFRGPTASPVLLSNKAAVIVQETGPVELRAARAERCGNPAVCVVGPGDVVEWRPREGNNETTN